MRLTRLLMSKNVKDVVDLVGDMTIKESNLPRRYVRRAMEQVCLKKMNSVLIDFKS